MQEEGEAQSEILLQAGERLGPLSPCLFVSVFVVAFKKTRDKESGCVLPYMRIFLYPTGWWISGTVEY